MDMAHVRPGVVIGGGHNVSGRHGGRQQGGMRHARYASPPRLFHVHVVCIAVSVGAVTMGSFALSHLCSCSHPRNHCASAVATCSWINTTI